MTLPRIARSISLIVALMITASANAEDWPRFRGPNGSGLSASADVPMTWSDSENVKWKIELPGPGGSSPIVFGDRVYLTYYTGFGRRPGKSR